MNEMGTKEYRRWKLLYDLRLNNGFTLDLWLRSWCLGTLTPKHPEPENLTLRIAMSGLASLYTGGGVQEDIPQNTIIQTPLV